MTNIHSFPCFPEEEKELAELVMTFARHGFPFTELKLRKLAYELAKANRRKGFSPEKKLLANGGYRGFSSGIRSSKKRMQRTCQYTELSVQMPTRLPSSSSCTNHCYCSMS